MNKIAIFFMIGLIAFLTGCGSNENKSFNTQQSAADTTKTPPPATATATKNILFFGNSLTAGYGVDPTQAFPALIQQKID